MQSITRLFDIPHYQRETYNLDKAMVTKYDGEWRAVSSGEYLDQAILLKRESLRWDEDSSIWWRRSLDEYTYDEHKNCLTFFSEGWISSWQLNFRYKGEYINDYTAGTITRKTYWYEDDEWIPGSRAKEVYASADDLTIVNSPYEDEEICVVTVSSQNRNLLVWEKTPGEGTLAYNIYREGDVANEYEKIGTQPFESLSIFIDEDSDPREQAYRYKIASVNVCGESGYSNYHQTIHLQISPGMGTYNLDWSKYEYEGGTLTFVTHEILRGTSLANMAQIGSVSGNKFSFTDTDPPGDTLYYQIRGILELPCYPSGQVKATHDAYQHSLSNVEDNRDAMGVGSTAAGSLLRIYPNPMAEKATILIPDPGKGTYHLSLTDLSGKLVRIVDNVFGPSYELKRMGLPAGFYLIELKGARNYQGKLILE